MGNQAETEVGILQKQVERLSEQMREAEQEAAKHRDAVSELRTVNRRLEQQVVELEEARSQAEAEAEEKSSFLASMSHEIRTPMTAILGFAELLQEIHGNRVEGANEAEDETRRHIQMIRTCGAQLLNLINDILDISKIHRRSMRMNHGTVSLVQLFAEVVDVMRPAADEKSLALGVHFLTPIPDHIRTDRSALTRILMNLVSNAIKFTEKGGIRIEVRFQGTGESKLDIKVIDSGIGISSENLNRLFMPFFQANTTPSRITGSGLGLTISKELARLLGGDMEVHSHVGEGSIFHFWLPCSSEEARTLIRAEESRFPAEAPQGNRSLLTGTELPYRILVAEDVETNRVLIDRILRKAGAAVSLAKNGGAAIAAALESLREKRPFDAILMDMLMPGVDGYEATRILRERGYVEPIIALTASAMGSDKMRCLRAGCDDYLTKPIDRGELTAVIRRHVEARRGDRANAEA